MNTFPAATVCMLVIPAIIILTFFDLEVELLLLLLADDSVLFPISLLLTCSSVIKFADHWLSHGITSPSDSRLMLPSFLYLGLLRDSLTYRLLALFSLTQGFAFLLLMYHLCIVIIIPQ